MTVNDYMDLIEKGEEIRHKIQSVICTAQYKSAENFPISGYDMESVDDFIRVAINIIGHIEVK